MVCVCVCVLCANLLDWTDCGNVARKARVKAEFTFDVLASACKMSVISSSRKSIHQFIIYSVSVDKSQTKVHSGVLYIMLLSAATANLQAELWE